MSALLLSLVFDLGEGFIGAMFHAPGLRLASAPIAGLVDGPADEPRLRVAKNLDAAALRPETSGVVKGADELADLASVTKRRLAYDSRHGLISSTVFYQGGHNDLDVNKFFS
jgi:hypothetical protein